MLNFTKCHHVGNNTCLYIVDLEVGAYLEVNGVLKKENIWKLEHTKRVMITTS